MDIDALKIGDAVGSVWFPEDEGIVESIDYEENTVWVRFPPVNGVPQIVDIDPDDLGLI